MQITFNATVTVIQQTWFRGNDTDELPTFNSVLQMERGLCRRLLMPGNKWGNYEHTPHDSSITYICDMAQHVFNLPHANSYTELYRLLFSFISYVSWMKICSSLSHITGTNTTCQICCCMPLSKEKSCALCLFCLKSIWRICTWTDSKEV